MSKLRAMIIAPDSIKSGWLSCEVREMKANKLMEKISMLSQKINERAGTLGKTLDFVIIGCLRCPL